MARTTAELKSARNEIAAQSEELEKVKATLNQKEAELESLKQTLKKSENRVSLSNLFDVMDSDKMNKKAGVRVNELELELKRLNEAFNERRKLLTKTTKELKAARNELMKQKEEMAELKAKSLSETTDYRESIKEQDDMEKLAQSRFHLNEKTVNGVDKKEDQIHSFHMVILVNIIIQKKDLFS